MTFERCLVVGTHNRKKGLELTDLLAPHQFRVLTLADVPNPISVDETGTTFAENAALKASRQARHLRQWVLGEDSGLCVDALDGRPGVYSARYSGPNATDEGNNQLLLRELGDLSLEKRTAFYVCHVAVADPNGDVQLSSEDCCRGRIRFEPAGSSGFGYDPLFEIPEYHRTFGQLGDVVKSLLSHRSRVLRRVIPGLLRLFE